MCVRACIYQSQLRAEDLAVKGFDAAGGAAMKMFLTVAWLGAFSEYWGNAQDAAHTFVHSLRNEIVWQVEYEKPDPDLHTELFCKYPRLGRLCGLVLSHVVS